ncbi:MAG: site-2 protease family protein [Candidatus Pacearchaeota archaeon]|jgi:membrane-associated protease RseP (regulator of RpoE activity)
METFTIVDLSLLVAFAIFVGIFLYINRRNLKKDGLFFLYRTKWGINLINKTAKKYPKTLKVLAWISVIVGYILMILMVYLFIRILWIYLFHADVVRAVKLPPVAPLIPYLPQIFKVSFLPNFYFIHWIIILAVIAIFHEFFHGIFAALYKVKIKQTGFGFFPFFLPILPAAFVELDEKVMQKKKNFQQRAVLSAGTFANILTALLGLIIIFVFFHFSFAPSGVVFDDYAYDVINVSSVTAVNGISLLNPTYSDISPLIIDKEKNYVQAGNSTYAGIKGVTSDKKQLAVYFDSPAINSEIFGAIISINGQEISNLEDFQNELSKYSVGEKIILTTKTGDEIKNYEINLSENPENPGTSWLGISFYETNSKGAMAKIVGFFSSYKKPHIYYEEKYNGAQFIYDFLWWLVLIAFSVALVNMLPMGVFDGGRFFYLTVFAITKREKIAMKSFKIFTYILLFLLILIMVYWAKSFF